MHVFTVVSSDTSQTTNNTHIIVMLCMNLGYPEVLVYGPTEANFGSNVSINCTVLNGPLRFYIITPQGEVINNSVINFNATVKNAGTYTCVANNSMTNVTRTHSLIVNGVFYLKIMCVHYCTYIAT